MKRIFLPATFILYFAVQTAMATTTSYLDQSGNVCANDLSDDLACATYLNTRIALGDYQTVVDQIEPIVTDLKLYQKYFLGAAYFALSGRAGAHSLKCHYTLQAKTNLGQFLEDRAFVYDTQRTLGDAEALKHAYAASRMVAVLSNNTGCEETAESTASLNRYGKAFLQQRIQDLFYQYPSAAATQSGVERVFTDGMSHMQGKVRGFVSVASKMERDYQLIGLELQTGQEYLEEIRNIIESAFGAIVPGGNLVDMTIDAASGVPIYAYTDNFYQLYDNVEQMTEYYWQIKQPGGAIGDVEQDVKEIMAKQQAEGMVDYTEKRREIIERLESTAYQMTVSTNLGKELGNGSGFHAISQATDSPGVTLAEQWQQIEAQWKDAQFGCGPESTQWYCL